jgi:hypothetical protein
LRRFGIFAISAVVERFSDAIITNPKLNQNPALKEWNEKESAWRLPGLKVMCSVWIAALAGGPSNTRGYRWMMLPKSFALRQMSSIRWEPR